MDFSEINWNELRKSAQERKTGGKKNRADWNKRAAGFAQRTADSYYAAEFIRRMNPDSTWSVLDIGAGPGNLALPLARKVRSVTALDFSSEMLGILRSTAEQTSVTNIHTVEASWTDDWHDLNLPAHDVVIASRSLAVDDLKSALTKLNTWAKKAVFISDRVGSGPFAPEAHAAIGRPYEPGPDYIYTMNILYQMGIHASLEFIRLPEPFYSSRQEALAAFTWMFHDLTEEENGMLTAFTATRVRRIREDAWQVDRDTPVDWALMRWCTEESLCTDTDEAPPTNDSSI